MKPLFMWAGGKTRLIKYYDQYMPKNVDTYYEPFFGGGAMCVEVIKRYNPKRIIINDINADIMNIYAAIKNNVADFMADVDSLEKRYLPLNKQQRRELYFKLRHMHAYDYTAWSKVREAAVLYFLMKTGFNGIYQINKNTNNRFGTPAGLLNQVDKVYDRNVVLWWHNALQVAQLHSVDWRKLDYVDTIDAFIFLDPPYRGSFTSYGQAFTDADQSDLLAFSEKFNVAQVFLTNREIGDGFYDKTSLSKISIPVVYTAGRRKQTTNGFEAKQATELLLFNKINNETI